MRLVLGIACAALLPASAPASSREPPTSVTALPTSGRLTLFQSPNRVLVMVRIGEGDLVPMVFDTGSDGNSIDRTLTRRLRLKRVGETHEIDGTTGKERILPNVAIRDVALGGLGVGTINAVSLEMDRDDAMGIISSELFTGSLLYLDLANDRAILVPRETAQTPSGAPTPYTRGIPSTEIVMPDGSTLPAHFDTGYNDALSLPIAMMDKVPLVEPARIVGRFKSINTEGPVYGGRVRGTIRIGPVTLENPDVTFLGDLANIGLPVIRRVTLVIDPAADRNWVLASGVQPPTR